MTCVSIKSRRCENNGSENRMNHVYGPVPSRRLGFSLGVDLVPFKTCTLDCIYCQLGRTTRKTVLRRPYLPQHKIIAELKETLARGQEVDYITLSGSGEPTLHSQMCWIIDEIKKTTDIPVAILTNGTRVNVKTVRMELSKADLVIPSLDAVSQEIFERINRPHPSLRIDEIIGGLKAFREQFKGQIWLEVMLVKGINDRTDAIESLQRVIPELGADKTQLNTVIRPPSEAYTRSLDYDEMSRIKSYLGEKSEIIPRFSRRGQNMYKKDLKDQILDLLGRRPVTVRDISEALGLHENEVIKYLETLSEAGEVKAEQFDGSTYYYGNEEELASTRN
jgi:wyosine [tRNA(Phe)-imidazoG37] synthetase (radical SAM superfamily)